MQTSPVLTADFTYLRFIGDRSIPEDEFGKIQKDRDNEMQYWAKQFNKLSKDKGLKNGFGPATANMFRKLVGLPKVVWEEMKQATLSDF